MPRLHIWMLGATLAGCGQYVFCKHFYGDRYTEREEMESSIQAEKSYLLQLMQRYALLHRSIQDLPGSSCTTNRERLSVYCKIQQLREVIHNLPLKSMSAVDRKAMLLQLDGLEAAQCTPLNFRDEALTISEIVMCQFCYGFYLLCFCVIDPLLRRVAAERVRRQFLHRTSKMILHCLRIPVTMAFEPQAEYINDEKEGKLCCLVFSPQHWVEVVGFWACPLNPLLLSTHLQLWQLSLREVVPFSEYWHEQWCRMQRELVDAAVVSDPVVEYSGGRILQPTDSINTVKGSDSPVTSTYGYPRALRRGYEGSPVLDPEMKNLTGVHPSSAASAAGPHFVPVASCGLPRLLYINEAVARPDVRPRPTQKEIYTQLQHLQYPESLGCSSGVRKINASGGNAKDCNLKAEKGGELLLQLRSWYSCGGIPWWHRATWGAAYGGVGRRGNCDWRGLSFRLGRPCSADQLLKEQMGANGVLRSHCISCFVSRRQQSAKKDGTSADEGKQTPPYCHTGENYCGSASVPRTEAVNARMMQTSAAYPRVHVTLHDPQKSKSEEADELSRCGGGKGVNGINDKAETVFDGNRVGDLSENEVRAFLFRKEREIAHHHQQRNSTIPYPPHPDDVVPQFRRIKRHQQMLVVALDPDYPVYDRRDNVPELPPAQPHPWVKKTPTGPFIVHGDGQLGVVGTGEVGFEDAFTSDNTTEVAAATMGEVMLPLPRDFRGLQHRSTLHQSLPSCNGKVLQETVIKNSFALTGRGVFTTRDVSAGETIMIVRNTARNLGVKSEIERLVEMCTDVLSDTYNNFCNGNPQKLDFLHDWVLTGQPSSLLLHWPRSATKQVLECIGGAEVLHALELHEIHIARLAAIMDMNSFLVESSYAVRKGMAYFPEAGFFNHSCSPNATYDVIPAHTFCETDYYVDELGDSANAAFCATNYGEYTKSSNNDIVDATSGRNTTSDTKSDRDASEDECMEDVHNADGNQIIPSGTVEYLFCCRATADIPAGSEILISYVPPEWSFDNRQYVLHDRYRFWCKCPKCAPTLDSKYTRTPRLLVAMLIFSIFLQLLVMRQRDMEHATMRERETGEEEEMRHGESGREKPKRRARGLFELLEESRQEEMYTPDRGPIPERVAQDPWARPAR